MNTEAHKTGQNPNTWAMLCHLTALSGLIGVPFGNLLGPLIIWLIKKDEVPEVNEHGKESLNFQISMTLYAILAGILILVFVGIILLGVLFIAELILVIMASVQASKGQSVNYPLTIRFIK
jgi:hypothetical protein